MKKLINILKGVVRGIWGLFMISVILLAALAVKVHIENETLEDVEIPLDLKGKEPFFPELVDPWRGLALEQDQLLKEMSSENQKLLSQNNSLFRERFFEWAKPELYQTVKVPIDSQIVLWETVKEFGKIVVEKSEPTDTLITDLYEMLLSANPIDRALADTLSPEHLTDERINIHFLGKGENLNPLSINYQKDYDSWGGYAKYNTNLAVLKVYSSNNMPWVVSAVFHELMHHYLREKFPEESKSTEWQHSLIEPVEKKISEILYQKNQETLSERLYDFDFSYLQLVDMLGEVKEGKRSFLSEIKKSDILTEFRDLEYEIEGIKNWNIYFYSASSEVYANRGKFKKDKNKMVLCFNFTNFDLFFDKNGFVILKYDGEDLNYKEKLEQNKEKIASLAFTDLKKRLSLQTE